MIRESSCYFQVSVRVRTMSAATLQTGDCEMQPSKGSRVAAQTRKLSEPRESGDNFLRRLKICLSYEEVERDVELKSSRAAFGSFNG